MVIIKVAFGMGNQLFQYAAARCVAHKMNTELKIDKTYFESENLATHERYKLDNFNIPENFATSEDIKNLTSQDVYMKEGLWQKDIFFNEIKEIIQKEFTLKNPLGKISAKWKEKILSTDFSVALHVRCKDYRKLPFRVLFGVLPAEYYNECIDSLKKDFPAIKLFVFSDDLNWVKNHLTFQAPAEFVEGCEHDYEEMYLMSLCKHNIVSNGTFAWWGAWLNKNPNKKVFAPTPWFRNTIIGGTKDGIIPDDWIKIPCNFETNFDVIDSPLLSIIFFVKDNEDYLPLTIHSILTQNLSEYEIIIIHKSTGRNSEFIRQFAFRKNISILRTMSDSIAQAYNLAMDCSTGKYLLFLDSDSFIFPDTVKWLWNIGYDLKLETVVQDIICSTQSFEEDENGTIVINGIPNKKFSLKVDSAFQNLNGVTELFIPNNQKLIALGTKSISNNISTKIFKRKFLIENNIRFREGGGMDAELSFVVDAFLATEKITFASQPLLGQRKKN